MHNVLIVWIDFGMTNHQHRMYLLKEVSAEELIIILKCRNIFINSRNTMDEEKPVRWLATHLEGKTPVKHYYGNLQLEVVVTGMYL